MAAPILHSRLSASFEPLLGPKGLLRFTTAGSVDDGKSTMIGRLLYDAKSVYEDQLRSIQSSRINRADGPIDFSLLTDGLRAEREQGITIDVAYRYFSTPKRKFIIADTPGHEQYTRNMVTGASTADAAIILIDARKGLLAQSRRHTYIASLLGIQHVIAAVNKMDLVEYREDVFREIAHDFTAFAGRLGVRNVYAIPISALKGDGIVIRGDRMEWFDGPPLLEHLENLPNRTEESSSALRLPIQYVIRPNSDFRGFAGQVVSGQLRTGAKVIALPSFMQTRVKSIVTFDGEIKRASVGSSITFTLEDEIDLGRGDLLANEEDLPQDATQFVANLVWMDSEPSKYEQDYVLKHTTRVVRGRLGRILHRVDVNTLERIATPALKMNDIAAVQVETTKPLLFDPYQQNRATGSFILIDPITNATVAAGMIQGPGRNLPSREVAEIFQSPAKPPVELEPSFSKRGRKRHLPAVIWVVGRSSLAKDMEHAILQNGCAVQLVSGEEFGPSELKAIATILRRRQVVTILSLSRENIQLKEAITAIFGESWILGLARTLSDSQSLSLVLDWIHDLRKKKEKRGPGNEARIN
jgi:sulfate adenylyltransferase large subunit